VGELSEENEENEINDHPPLFTMPSSTIQTLKNSVHVNNISNTDI